MGAVGMTYWRENGSTSARRSSALFAAGDAELIIEKFGEDDIIVKFQ